MPASPNQNTLLSPVATERVAARPCEITPPARLRKGKSPSPELYHTSRPPSPRNQSSPLSIMTRDRILGIPSAYAKSRPLKLVGSCNKLQKNFDPTSVDV